MPSHQTLIKLFNNMKWLKVIWNKNSSIILFIINIIKSLTKIQYKFIKWKITKLIKLHFLLFFDKVLKLVFLYYNFDTKYFSILLKNHSNLTKIDNV